MKPTSRRAVITGIGVISPIGTTPERFWENLSRGQSGVHTIQSFDPSGLPVRIGGEITDFDARNYLEKKDRKSLKVMARTIQLAVAGAQKALEDSGIDKQKLDPTRFGVEFGASLIASELDELGVPAQLSTNGRPGSVDLDKWGELGLASMPPLWMLKYLPNMLACHVAILHDAQGPNNTITESDVASLLALGEAYRILLRNQADFFLTGGGDSKINPLSMTRQCLFQELSHRNDAPERASRPFDQSRDGMVIGEGAAILALEDLDHARRRGARIYAEMAGFGAAFDRGCAGSGLVRAAHAALADAGIGVEDVDHVNAHGYSTVAADRWEARSIAELLGRSNEAASIFAPKSYFGNLGSASGATELVASILALQQGTQPMTLNYETADAECPVRIGRAARPAERPYVLKLGFTEMGQCAAVVLKKWSEQSGQ